MGYKQRGLTLKELQEQGREIAAKGGSVKDMAIIIAEDNFALSMVNKYTVLAKTTRASIMKRVKALSDEDKQLYNYYLSFAHSLFQEIPEIEAAERNLRKNFLILSLYLRVYMTASNYEVLLCSITPILKESRVYDKVKDRLEEMKECWTDKVVFPDDTSSFKGLEGNILSDLQNYSQRTEIQLKQCLIYDSILRDFLSNDEIAPFVPDYALERLQVIEEYSAPYERCSAKYLKEMEEELNELKEEYEQISTEHIKIETEYYRLQYETDSAAQAGEDISQYEKDSAPLKEQLDILKMKLHRQINLIFEQEKDISICRQYAVYPDKEMVRSGITPDDILPIISKIKHRITDERKKR